MAKVYVKSSSIHSVDYDSARQTLEVEFNTSGFVYRYLDVPQSVYDELLEASSVGSYIAHHIKGTFDSEKLLF